MQPHPPSGRQFKIAHDLQQAVVTEVGAGLRSYEVRRQPVIAGYEEDQMCKSGRGQVLMPWPNRIAGGAYEFDGAPLQLALTEPRNGNAIHGLVRWVPWTAREHQSDRVLMGYTLHPQPGYPFTLELTVSYRLSEDGLSVRTTARNLSDRACPFGAGAHPYLTLGTPTVDPLVLRVPAATVLDSDERGIPTGSTSVEGTEFDFRAERAIGATILDHAFTDLERGNDGLARVLVGDSEDAHGIELWVDGSYTHLMVFTGDPLPDVNRRAVAIEPMTCAPDAFRTDEGVIRLEPGESVSLAWGLRLITPIG